MLLVCARVYLLVNAIFWKAGMSQFVESPQRMADEMTSPLAISKLGPLGKQETVLKRFLAQNSYFPPCLGQIMRFSSLYEE
ncbi:MAG: hypothetical protein ACI9FB_002415 [Candidatus Azotimanducaceae bacterium]